jgi:hypothetical protein
MPKKSLRSGTPELRNKRDRTQVVEELRKMVSTLSGKNRPLLYTKRYMGDPIEKNYQQLLRWLVNPSKMTADEVRKAIKSMAAFRKDPSTPVYSTDEERSVTPTVKIKKLPISDVHSSEINRKMVGHVITLLNSLYVIIDVASIEKKDATDGDRIQMRAAMSRISKRMGINARFSDKSDSINRPATSKDMSSLNTPSPRSV